MWLQRPWNGLLQHKRIRRIRVRPPTKQKPTLSLRSVLLFWIRPGKRKYDDMLELRCQFTK
jgi:hypothetical protein